VINSQTEGVILVPLDAITLNHAPKPLLVGSALPGDPPCLSAADCSADFNPVKVVMPVPSMSQHCGRCTHDSNAQINTGAMLTETK